MFGNVGKEIKITFFILFWVILVGGEIGGFYYLFTYGDSALGMSLPLIMCSPLVAWLICCLPYGLGELIQNSTIIAEKIQNGTISAPTAGTGTTTNYGIKSAEVNSVSKMNPEEKRRADINAMLAEGLISEEEYQSLINNK